MSLVEEIEYDLNFEKLQEQNPYILIKNPLVYRLKGMSLQHRKGALKPFETVDGLESLSLYENYNEKDFNILNESLRNTEYEKIINDLKMFRSRILILQSRECYKLHHDATWRIHIPLETNDNCLFFFPKHNKHFHLKQGKVYKVNTTEQHTFINAGPYKRSHIVGCIDY